MTNEMAASKLTVKELEHLLSADSPKLFNPGSGLAIEEVWHCGCRIRKRFHPRSPRSGGTLSGPTMMALADFAMYVAGLGSIGWVPDAVSKRGKSRGAQAVAQRCLMIAGRYGS